jgi:hypothetical protein
MHQKIITFHTLNMESIGFTSKNFRLSRGVASLAVGF